jgi:hypothetical protein
MPVERAHFGHQIRNTLKLWLTRADKGGMMSVVQGYNPRMTLSKRLILTPPVAHPALIVVGSVGLGRLNQAQQRFEYVQAHIVPSIKNLDESSSI